MFDVTHNVRIRIIVLWWFCVQEELVVFRGPFLSKRRLFNRCTLSIHVVSSHPMRSQDTVFQRLFGIIDDSRQGFIDRFGRATVGKHHARRLCSGWVALIKIPCCCVVAGESFCDNDKQCIIRQMKDWLIEVIGWLESSATKLSFCLEVFKETFQICVTGKSCGELKCQ